MVEKMKDPMSAPFKIISTLGPASLNRDFIESCRRNSQLFFRLNGSHLTLPEIERYVRFARENSEDHLPQFYLDLQGGKLRIGKLDAPLQLKTGESIEFILSENSRSSRIPLPHCEIFEQIRKGDQLVLQDGSVMLHVVEGTANRFTAQVLRGGEVRSGAGIYLPNRVLSPDELPPVQRRQIALAARLQLTHLALSYVRTAEEIASLRSVCSQVNYQPTIAAKIEHPEALENLADIAGKADEIWFCRGDLGTMISLKKLGYWQDKTVEIAKRLKKPILIAGQVFHHLTQNRQPTRSEVVHFFYLRKYNVDGIVLSDETAIGIDPVNALREIFALL